MKIREKFVRADLCTVLYWLSWEKMKSQLNRLTYAKPTCTIFYQNSEVKVPVLQLDILKLFRKWRLTFVVECSAVLATKIELVCNKQAVLKLGILIQVIGLSEGVWYARESKACDLWKLEPNLRMRLTYRFVFYLCCHFITHFLSALPLWLFYPPRPFHCIFSLCHSRQ